MGSEQLVVLYSPVGDMISIICSGVLLYIIAKVLYFSNDSKFLYMKRAICLIMVASLANIAFDLVASRGDCSIVLLFVLRDIYHVSLMCCLYCYILYMKEMLDVRGGFVIGTTHLTRLVFVLTILLDLLSPFTHFGFYYADGFWSDKIISPYNIFYLYAVIVLFAMLISYSDRLIRSVRSCLVVAELVVAVIMFHQGVRNTNSFSTFTFILPVLVVMILVHSKPFNDKTGALSSSSFESFVKQSFASRISVDYMVLKLNMNILDTLPDELGKVLNSFWHNYFKDALLFELDNDLFVLAIPREDKNGDTEVKIKELMNKGFPKYYAQYQIPYKVLGLFDIDFIESELDFIGIITYLLSSMDEDTIHIIDDDMREELRIFKTVRENLADIERKGDLNDSRVIVYCQPIRNMKTDKYDTAEALMRLSLDGENLLRPEMFIPIAEQYGYIHALTKIMLNKVCIHIKHLEDEGFDFNRISVNFAASEIKAENYCDEVLTIIRSNGIAPSRIGIELTETQTENDFMIVKNKMAILREAGMTLYLDDVGTGYSNLDRIVKYDVDVVKFDRFFILEAEKDEKVVKMMKYLSMAFKELNYKLLYEGVETNENQDLCIMCGADYIQGFKYSKPVPIERLVDFFEK